MHILNIAGYKFITLHALEELQTHFLDQCQALHLKGTVLLSPEGINISLAGRTTEVHQFKQWLASDARFADMRFHQSPSDAQPFQRLKIKIKKEIITLRQSAIDPEHHRAPSISPHELKQWLDEKSDVILLDTRNDYEVALGTFENAVNLHLENFTDLHHKTDNLEKEKPIVMFCTGGIRCEKAAILLQQKGFKNVYQLDGGILQYFKEVGDAHYQGECFVFDERVSVKASNYKN